MHWIKRNKKKWSQKSIFPSEFHDFYLDTCLKYIFFISIHYAMFQTNTLIYERYFLTFVTKIIIFIIFFVSFNAFPFLKILYVQWTGHWHNINITSQNEIVTNEIGLGIKNKVDLWTIIRLPLLRQRSHDLFLIYIF